jgi:NTE family protein
MRRERQTATRQAGKAVTTRGRKATTTRRVNLALQGGGSHGAFTWGVLDALLEDGRLDFDGITGASAGAMNAVVLADGWCAGLAAQRDPREQARAALATFWRAIGAQPSAFALAPPWRGVSGDLNLVNPLTLWLDLLSRFLSPYQLNPLDINPLRQAVARSIDFERLRASPPFKLFVCATNVRTGRPRIFREHEIAPAPLLASACLPYAFQAVEVDGEHYWDGGYMGNPALYPLFYASKVDDLVLVQINPLVRDELPDSAQEIVERSAEISFNASLLHEMRAIEFVQRLLREKRLDPNRYRRVRLHMIDAEARMRAYGAGSKVNTSPAFLEELFAIGRTTAQEWLEMKFAYVGNTSSVRIAEFL